ncbi:MAG: hypothetical protein C0593_12570 [Marinilabiliales bacterium]|nr:MAG: hypothetical protein C0593_12570 [Marinilabiliales bacterium]
MFFLIFCLPIIIIRYIFPLVVGMQSGKRLALMPVYGAWGKIAVICYLFSNTFLLFSPLFFKPEYANAVIVSGIMICCLSLVFYFLSVRDFCRENSLITSGVYRLTRNPQTIAFFGLYLGIALSFGSVMYYLALLMFIISIHKLLLMEEKYCRDNFGKAYIDYCCTTARYI